MSGRVLGAIIAAVATAGAVLAPAAPARDAASGGRYEDLVALFQEWRAFQKPRVREGVPDYTSAAMAEQQRRRPDLQRRLQAIGHRGWPVAQQVDWHLVRAEMNGLDFDHRNIWDSRAEGLATAMEEMMASAGLLEGRSRGRELMYGMVAQRAARGLASLRVHAQEMGIEQAVSFAHRRTPYGWLKVDGGLVWGEQGLYLEQPGYGTCYLSGKAQIERLLADRARQEGEAFTLRRFMDDLNGAGLIPVSLIRWELTGLDDELKRLE